MNNSKQIHRIPRAIGARPDFVPTVPVIGAFETPPRLDKR